MLMLQKNMFYFMFHLMNFMVVYQKEVKMSKFLEVESKLLHLKNIVETLFYGNLALKMNQVGNLHGDSADQDGI